MTESLFLYKLVSKYPEDVTKNCKLSINEVDQDLMTLKDFDIKTAQLHLIILLRDGYNEESAARCGSDSVVRSD